MLARNAAWRRRNCSAESLYAFRAARNRFHRIVHAVKNPVLVILAPSR